MLDTGKRILEGVEGCSKFTDLALEYALHSALRSDIGTIASGYD